MQDQLDRRAWQALQAQLVQLVRQALKAPRA
jgi:hypothetical protein